MLDTQQAPDFKVQLDKDTELPRKCNAIDYTLFLCGFQPPQHQHLTHSRLYRLLSPAPRRSRQAHFPFVPPGPSSWRTGIESANDQYVYRAAVLDFFWAKHKVYAKAMTGLIKLYNLTDQQGPMSVTTTAPEYRERFLKMCSEIVEVKERSENAGTSVSLGDLWRHR